MDGNPVTPTTLKIKISYIGQNLNGRYIDCKIGSQP
jgi:hypothetical protein